METRGCTESCSKIVYYDVLLKKRESGRIVVWRYVTDMGKVEGIEKAPFCSCSWQFCKERCLLFGRYFWIEESNSLWVQAKTSNKSAASRLAF